MTPEMIKRLRRIYWALDQKPVLTSADGPEIQLARLNMMTEAVNDLLALTLAEHAVPFEGDED